MRVRALLATLIGVGCLSGALPLQPAFAQVQAGGHEPPRNLTVEDYFRIGEVSEPRLSPDGEWVAYTVTTRDLEKDKAESRIWMVPTSGGEAIPMTAKGSSSSHPRWSPDGRYLAFLSKRNGDKAQVWTLFRHGGDAVQLTETVQGVSTFEWSPEGDRLALVLQDPKPEDLEEKDEKEDEENEEEAQPPWVIDRLQIKRDYEGYLDHRRKHLYVFDVSSKETVQITFGDYDDEEPAWSPDGKAIAFASNRTDDPDHNYNTDIWLAPADNPDGGDSLVQLTTNPGPDQAPAWSRDGKWVAHVSETDVGAIVYAVRHLAVVSSKGGQAQVLTETLDRNVGSPRFSPDSRSIYFLLEDSGEQNLAVIPVGGGPVQRPISGSQIVEEFDLVRDGAIAASISQPHLSEEIYLYQGEETVQLSHTNAELFAEFRLGEVEEVEYESRDGTKIEGFVVKPPGFTPSLRYPTLLRIHGGPMSQYDSGFHFEAQLFAAHGYVVAMPNPRGSSGYGQDFMLAIWQEWGERDSEDVLAMVDELIERGYADPDRLGVGGWSYGGMLTNHVLVRTDRFKAAITGASAALYVTNYGHDQYQRWWEYELGLPWQSRELWEKISPFNQVEKIVTPTLIVGGEKDWNVPIINSEQLYQALRRLGRSTELVVYPGEYHSIRRPSYRKDLYERYLTWYDRYVKGTPPSK